MNKSTPDSSSLNLNRLIIAILGITLLLAGCGGGGGGSSSDSGDDSSGPGGTNLTLAELGERIFFDENLSNPVGQSCSSCHVATAGFADPTSIDKLSPVSVGADGVSVGSRNAPTASYAAFIPSFTQTPPIRGGQFLDGRASTLEEQARAPFLNPLEMNMTDEVAVVAKLRVADYAGDFLNIFGASAFDNVSDAYTRMVTAIATFERTDPFAPFSSKFDDVVALNDTFTPEEAAGRALFSGAAGCSRCHRSPVGTEEVFSDFRYTNIGVPANPTNSFLIANPTFVDNGLGAVLGNSAHNGKFRAPTLRNVAETAPYMHNGIFDNLEEVMEFYNVRADPHEVADNVENPGNINAGDIGNLNLSQTDIDNVILFLETLSDN